MGMMMIDSLFAFCRFLCFFAVAIPVVSETPGDAKPSFEVDLSSALP
jgi:hypothetical protein